MVRNALIAILLLNTHASYANICNQSFLATNKPSSNITEIEKKYLIQDQHTNYLTGVFKSYFLNWNQLISSIKTKGDVVTQGFLPAELHSIVSKEFNFTDLDFTPTEVRLVRVVRTQNKNKIDYIYSAKGPGTYSRRETEFYITKHQFLKFWPESMGRRVHRLRLDLEVLTAVGLKEISLDYYLDRKLFIAEVEFQTKKEGEGFSPLGLDVTEVVKYKNASLAF